jgi:hypothetical protein
MLKVALVKLYGSYASEEDASTLEYAFMTWTGKALPFFTRFLHIYFRSLFNNHPTIRQLQTLNIT